MSRPLLLSAQIMVSIALLVLLARQVPLRDSLEAMRRVRPITVLVATALALVGFAGRAARWASLLRHAGVAIRPWEAYRLTLLGVGYGLATPGRVGEFVRAAHVVGSAPGRVASVVWDRLADVLLLELMSLPAFLFVPAWRGPILGVYLLLVACTLGVVFAVDHPRVAGALSRAFPPLERLFVAWGARGTSTLASRAFGVGLAGGLFFYAFSYAGAWLVLSDLVRPAPPLVALSFPLVPLIGNLPIAFGGLGLREQVSAHVFGAIGLAPAAGPAFSLVCFATSTLIPGAIGLLWRGVGALGSAPTSTGSRH